MKGLFPGDKQEILINLPIKEFGTEFKKNIQLTGYIRFFKDSKSKRFYGTIKPNVWRVRLKTDYANPFKPVIYMKLVPEGNKTRIIFEFKVHIAVRIYLVIFLIVPVLMIINNLLAQSTIEDYYFPAGIIAFSIIMVYFGFYLSHEHTTEALNAIVRQIIATAGRNS